MSNDIFKGPGGIVGFELKDVGTYPKLKERGYELGFMFERSCDNCEDPNIVYIYTKMIDTTELVIRVWADDKIDYYVNPCHTIRSGRDIYELDGAFEILEDDLRSVGLDWVVDKQYEHEWLEGLKKSGWTYEKIQEYYSKKEE